MIWFFVKNEHISTFHEGEKKEPVSINTHCTCIKTMGLLSCRGDVKEKKNPLLTDR